MNVKENIRFITNTVIFSLNIMNSYFNIMGVAVYRDAIRSLILVSELLGWFCIKNSDTDMTINLFYGRREGMFYLTTHSTHFIYGYMASDIW